MALPLKQADLSFSPLNSLVVSHCPLLDQSLLLTVFASLPHPASRNHLPFPSHHQHLSGDSSTEASHQNTVNTINTLSCMSLFHHKSLLFHCVFYHKCFQYVQYICKSRLQNKTPSQVDVPVDCTFWNTNIKLLFTDGWLNYNWKVKRQDVHKMYNCRERINSSKK